MSKYLPTILAAIAALMPTVSVDVANAVSVFIAHNTVLSGWLVSIVWALYHFLPSPIQSQIVSAQMPPVSSVGSQSPKA